jgi:hypothetical protein
MRRIAVLCLVVAACGAQQRPGVELMDDIRTYQEGLRWRRWDEAALRLPPGRRDAFLETHEELDAELRIVDYEIERVRLAPGSTTATVQVKYTWHLDSVGVVHDSIVEQRWRRVNRAWFLVAERLKRGEDFPGLEIASDPD